jgi:glycosyltransferase involved in cell wall biosynthesis
VVRPAAGGIRQHVIDLIRNTPPDEVMHAVAAPESFLGSLPSDLPLLTCIPIEITSSIHPVKDMKAAMQLAGPARSDFEVVHAHGLRAAWVASIARKTRRFTLLCTAHNLVPASSASRTALAFISSLAAGIVAVSPAVEETLVACGVPSDMVLVVPNGVDYEAFAAVREDTALRESFRADMAVQPRTFVIGCVARLSHEKGIDILIKAAYDMPDVLFVVAGDGPDREALEAKGQPNVRLLGRLDDVKPLLAGVDAFLAPSRQEGQGIAVLEAMAAGLPVVASRVGGLAHMLTDSSDALLTQVGDARAIVVALRRLQSSKELRAKLTDAARFLVREEYDIRKTSASVVGIYRQLCGLD